MRPELYITDLLFRHDCVIVPELGAFISRSLPAEIAASTHMFRPARKQVAFNASLTQSDGLLYNYVARINACSFETARLMVDQALAQWKKELAEGKKIRLEHIGQLYRAEQGTLQFVPALESNFLLSSYGMGIFHVPAIETPLATKAPAAKVTEAASIAPDVAIRQRQSWQSWKWAAVLVPLMTISGLGWWQRQEIQAAIDSYSSIGPALFITEEPAETLVPTAEFEGVQGLKTKSMIPFGGDSASKLATKEAAEKPVARPVKTLPQEPKRTAALPEKVLPVKVVNAEQPLSSSNYFIVVGSFRETANTQKMIGQLRSRGFDAVVAPGQGLQRVAAAHFNSREEAQEALKSIQQQVEASAWIYRP
jgi:cell division septation protein DedD